jgi:hypothetical protein
MLGCFYRKVISIPANDFLKISFNIRTFLKVSRRELQPEVLKKQASRTSSNKRPLATKHKL